MLPLSSLLLLLLSTIGFWGSARGLEWDNSPEDYVYACAGSRITFPWHFKVGAGESVVGVNWMHDGPLSSTMVATMVRDHFVATGAYSARVRHVDNGGLAVEDLEAGDSGNYTVEVNVATGGLFKTFRRSAFLQVAEGLMLKGQLTAEQDAQAWWDDSAQQWFLRLTCGSFTFQGTTPPADLQWTTPGGQTEASSGYEAGQFYLSVPTPVQGGNYTCTIPPASLPDFCYKGDNQQQQGDNPRFSASVNVDDRRARMSLLEANQNTLRESNAQLREMIDSLNETHARDMQNLTEQCQAVTRNLDEQLDRLQTEQQELEDKVNFLTNKTRRAAMAGPCRYDQHTVLDDAWRATSEGQDNLHCDNNLEHGWYRLLLNGANAVIPTTCVPKNHCNTHAPQWLDLKGNDLPEMGEEVEGRACANWDSDCCNWESPLRVRNCGEYFVYQLQPRSNCHLAYCLERQQ